MTCSGRWAEAWQFAGFWCTGAILARVDDGGGAAVAFLSDSQADFVTSGVRANAGMILYNLTTSLNGPVTAVTTTTITATGVTWTNGDFYRIVTIDAQEIATIELYLDIAASDIHAAMAGSGMCDCTLANWATAYLEKLNIIDAASYYQCPCGQPHMTDEMRQSYLRWCSDQLALIRTGQTELCHGATGSDFPAVGWAEQGLTEFATAEIIANYAARNG